MIDVQKTVGTIVAVVWAGSALFGHEHWVDVEDYYPAEVGECKVHVCSGHDFPKSSMVLKDRVLRGQRVIAADGEASDYRAEPAGKRRSATVNISKPGVKIVAFELGPPQMKKPIYQAKAIVVAGGKDDEAAYAIGSNLEVLPLSRLSGLSEGKALPLAVLYDGARVAARITIEPENGKNLTLSTTSKRPAEFKIPAGGRYLLTASYKGKSCSLTLFIPRKDGSE